MIDEVKPSFTMRYFLLQVLVGIVTVSLGIVGTLLVTRSSVKENTIDVSSMSSQNLAALPEGAVGELEIYMNLTGKTKELIKSLFRYEITIANPSGQGIDDFTVSFAAPEGIKLSPEPKITSNPPELKETIQITRAALVNNNQTYKISLLNSGQSIKFSYLGYASELLSADPVKVLLMQKKNWHQKNVESVSEEGSSTRRIVRNFLTRRSSELRVADIVFLILVYHAFYLYFIPVRHMMESVVADFARRRRRI